MEIFKQPNGKYATLSDHLYFSKQAKNITLKTNLTEDEVIEAFMIDARDRAKRIMKSKDLLVNNKDMIKAHFTDKQYKEMGFAGGYDELKKFIPAHVENQSYCGHDCTTYGKCPTCGETVQNGMGGTDKVCPKCQQILTWGYGYDD